MSAVIHESVPRVDAAAKVLGAAQYASDVMVPGSLTGKLLQSTHAHAVIRGMDTSAAQALRGVRAVITAADLPDVRLGIFPDTQDHPILARGQVRYIGEPIAAVAADDERTAIEALSLIRVDYGPLPAVFDVVEAFGTDAPPVHDRPAAAKGLSQNVCAFSTAQRGDPNAAFATADYVFEDTFRTQIQHQAYTEPTSALASWDNAGEFTVWVTSKAIFGYRTQIAAYLGVPRTRVHVIGMKVGGAFGGKGRVTIEPLAAALARKARRPVRMTLTRPEEFTMTYPRHGSVIRLRTAVRRDGTLLARSAHMLFDTGAYATLGPTIAAGAAEWVIGPYNVPDYRVETYCVYTNKIVCGAFRGFGTPQAHFASESQMDMIAQRLGMDPLELRLRNVATDGWIAPNGQRVASAPLKQCLQAVSDASGWGTRALPPNHALGIGALVKHGGTLSSSADLRIEDDGTFVLSIGAVDCGQGSDTILVQIAAEVLGVSVQDIQVVGYETDTSPYDWGTAASRLTVVAGTAVQKAAGELREQILEHAAKKLEAAPQDLDIGDGAVFVKGAPDRSVSLRQVAFSSYWHEDGPLTGHASALIEGHIEQPPVTSGVVRAPHAAVTFGAQAVEVEVDPETGQVRVLQVWSAHDVGKALNPMSVEGQIEGAVVQAVGYALSEEIVIQDGIVKNTLLNDYLVPMPPDAPPVASIVLEVPDGESPGPFGAKPIGEHALLGIPSAIALAVERVTGGRITDLPITPEKVLAARAADRKDGAGS